jgi:hypothetical protein
LTTNPLSFNIASFDGIAANGKPYNFEIPTAIGTADVLTSKPIDLRYGAGTSKVVLSFYLQPQGYGERPDKDDKFTVLGKNVSGQWDIIREYEVRDNWKGFEFQSIPVIEAKFFHENFQLRFQVTTRLSGQYDVWNIDYIWLDKDREVNSERIVDIALSNAPDYLIKDYTAMPIAHFYQKSLLRDTIHASLNHLYDLTPNPIFYNIILSDALSKQVIGNLLARDSSILVKENVKQIGLRGFPTKFAKIPQNKARLHLKTEIFVNTREKIITNGFSTLHNDTLSTTTVLDNYYAYDDGSAEYGVSFNQKFGKIACEFDNIKADQLTHIDLLFVPLGTNINRETYNLYVWKKINIGGGSNKDSTLLVQNIILNYADSINKFTRIALNRPISLTEGKFYIGVEQLSDKHLTFGFDKNIDNSKKIYVNVNNQWLQPQNIAGSLMIRPVFRANTITATDDTPNLAAHVVVFPNPTQGILQVTGMNIEKIQLLNSVGQVVIQQAFDVGETPQLDIKHLPDGLYILYLQNQEKTVVRRVVLQK